MTSSEPLSIEEEYELQKEWMNDDKSRIYSNDHDKEI